MSAALEQRVEDVERDQELIRKTMQDISGTMKEVSDLTRAVHDHSKGVESELRSWVRTVQIAGGAVVAMGIFALSLFGWILTEKNGEIKSLQQTAVQNQVAITQLLEQHKTVLLELERQSRVDVTTMQALAEAIRANTTMLTHATRGGR